MANRLTFIFLLSILFSAPLAAQNENGKNPFRMSMRVSGAVPHPISNKAFRRSFTGIYDITANVNYQVFRGFVVGLQYEHNLWKTPDNKIPGLNTYAQAHYAGARVGYDHVINETTVAYCGLSAMGGKTHFYGISYRPDTSHIPLQEDYNYRAIGADAGVYFYTEGTFAIGLQISALFTNFDFNPYKLFLDQHKAYIASDLNGVVSHINFGFNLVYSFWRK
jgi:hypothetical protein